MAGTKRRGKTRIPEAVLGRTKGVAPSSTSPGPPAPPTRTEKPRHEVKSKLVARLRRLHPMD